MIPSITFEILASRTTPTYKFAACSISPVLGVKMLSPNVDFVTQCEVGIGDPLTTVTSGQRLRLPEEDGAGTQELDLNSLVFCLLLAYGFILVRVFRTGMISPAQLASYVS